MTRGAVVIALALVVAHASAQTPRFRWNLSAGPTMALSRDNSAPMPQNSCLQFCLSGITYVRGAMQGKHHVSLGVSRELGGSALTLRGEALYSRAETGINAGSWSQNQHGSRTLFAPLDEMYVAGLGLQWNAFPSRALSPYLLTSVGMALNRLRWNSDTSSRLLDSQLDQPGPFFAAGAGVRARIGRRELFVEWRKYRTPTLPGSTIVPFSLGLRM